MIKRFIDVGIAVKNLEAAMATYSRVLGVTPRMLTHTDYAYPGIKGARFYLVNATISLVASNDPHSPIAKLLETRGEGINHLTLEVTDLEQDIMHLAKQGLEFLTEKASGFPRRQSHLCPPQIAAWGSDRLRPAEAGHRSAATAAFRTRGLR